MSDSPYLLGAVYGGMLVEAISDPLPGLPEVLFDLQQDRKKNVALGKRRVLYSSIEAIRRRYQKMQVKLGGNGRWMWGCLSHHVPVLYLGSFRYPCRASPTHCLHSNRDHVNSRKSQKSHKPHAFFLRIPSTDENTY